MPGKVPAALLGRVMSILLLSVFLGSTRASEGGCVDVQPPSTGFGFFRRTVTCAQVADRGNCEDNVASGYCLLTCEACPVPPPVVEEASPVEEMPFIVTAPTPEADELDPEAAAAAAYREELLEQVAIMEDGTGEVEELPSLVYDRDLPLTPIVENATVNGGVPVVSEPSVEVPVADAPVAEGPVAEAPMAEGPVVEPLCDDRSALAFLAGRNLTTLIQAAELLNVASVLNDTSIKFTLFAPDNEAWEEAFPDLDKQLEDLESTREYLFSHIVADQILDELSDGKITPLSEAVLFVREDGTQIISRASTANVLETVVGCTWVVHVIDDVLGEGLPGASNVNGDFRQILQG